MQTPRAPREIIRFKKDLKGYRSLKKHLRMKFLFSRVLRRFIYALLLRAGGLEVLALFQ